MERLDKEDFIERISTFPPWVKNGDDLMKYAKHLAFRLHQSMVALRVYSTNCSLTDDQQKQFDVLYNDHELAYSEDTSEMAPFSEFTNQKN